MVRCILESLEFIAAIEQQVRGDRQLAQGQLQARRFLAATALWADGRTLDDRETDVGIWPRAAPRAREPNSITVSAWRTIASTISRISRSSST